MFAVVGVVGILFLAAVAIGIFYMAGQRSRGTDQQDRNSVAKDIGQQSGRPPRAQGRGDL